MKWQIKACEERVSAKIEPKGVYVYVYAMGEEEAHSKARAIIRRESYETIGVWEEDAITVQKQFSDQMLNKLIETVKEQIKEDVKDGRFQI